MAGWSRAKITAALYPFGAGAMALNVFFASLIGAALGLSVLTPLQSLAAGAVLGLPATWLFARHIRNLIAKAEACADDATFSQPQVPQNVVYSPNSAGAGSAYASPPVTASNGREITASKASNGAKSPARAAVKAASTM